MLGLKAGGSSPTFLLDEFLSQCIIVFIVFLPQWEKKIRTNRTATNRPKKSVIP